MYTLRKHNCIRYVYVGVINITLRSRAHRGVPYWRTLSDLNYLLADHARYDYFVGSNRTDIKSLDP